MPRYEVELHISDGVLYGRVRNASTARYVTGSISEAEARISAFALSMNEAERGLLLLLARLVDQLLASTESPTPAQRFLRELIDAVEESE